VSKKWRIYRRVGPRRLAGGGFPSRPGYVPGPPGDPAPGPPRPRPPCAPAPGPPGLVRLGALAQQLLVERFAPACVLINRKCEILYFAGTTQDYLVQPTGVATQDLMSRLRDGLSTKLRGAIRKAIRDGERPVVIASVRRGDVWHRAQVAVERLAGGGALEGLLLISMVD